MLNSFDIAKPSSERSEDADSPHVLKIAIDRC